MKKSAILLAGVMLASAAPLHGASAYTHKVLYSFCRLADCSDGQYPSAALVMDSSGNLFGTTSEGGKLRSDGHRHGVVFELTPNAGHTRYAYHLLHSFCAKANCADGDEPLASLILDQSGNLYGTTILGGDNDDGTVFKLSPTGGQWALSVLHRFCRDANCPDGEGPFQALTYAGQTSGLPYDGTSPLYGTTSGGGKTSNDMGTVFELTLDQASGTWREHVLYSFCGAAGCTPQLPSPSSTVTIGSDGSLYGTVDANGLTGNLYALTPHGSGFREETAYTFCALASCADGENPRAQSLAIDGSGNLYGTTHRGGANSAGTIYELDPANGHLTTLYSFCALANCADGIAPLAGVLRTSTGDLFGTTVGGGTGSAGGAAFLLHNGSLQVLYSFCSEANCADGFGAETGLIMDGGGVLYGVTQQGGANESGTVYALVP